MAKDSFILSQTRGGVGNLVVRRSNGKTIVSAKPTSVSNPRTYAQAETRMRLSAVSAFYSPLSTVLQQGVQGKNTPNSHSAFSSEAIGIMKAGGYAFPKGGGFFPYPFLLTRGSIPSVGATMVSDSSGLIVRFNFTIPTTVGIDYESVGGLTYYLQNALGIDAAKFQATFIIVDRRQAGGISQFFPRYFRIECDRSSSVALGDVLPSWIDPSGNVGGDQNFLLHIPSGAGVDAVAGAIIVSYYDGRKWLRSTEFLDVLDDVLNDRSGAEAYDLAVSSFMAAASSTDPDGRVYLDGYTRRAGGDEPGIDWSAYAIAIGNQASTAKIVEVGTGGLEGAQVIAVTLDDDRLLVLQGNDKMNAYGKAFRTDGGEKVTIPEGISAVSVTSEPGYYDFYSAVADLFGLPVSYMFT